MSMHAQRRFHGFALACVAVGGAVGIAALLYAYLVQGRLERELFAGLAFGFTAAVPVYVRYRRLERMVELGAA